MERRIIKILMLAIAGLTACYYDSEEDLYPSSECVTTDLSFETHIQPILERNCFSCHSAAANTANVKLEGHTEVMKHVNSGKLLGVINHETGFTPMPQGAPKLMACDIAKIEQWVADGSINN